MILSLAGCCSPAGACSRAKAGTQTVAKKPANTARLHILCGKDIFVRGRMLKKYFDPLTINKICRNHNENFKILCSGWHGRKIETVFRVCYSVQKLMSSLKRLRFYPWALSINSGKKLSISFFSKKGRITILAAG